MSCSLFCWHLQAFEPLKLHKKVPTKTHKILSCKKNKLHTKLTWVLSLCILWGQPYLAITSIKTLSAQFQWNLSQFQWNWKCQFMKYDQERVKYPSIYYNNPSQPVCICCLEDLLVMVQVTSEFALILMLPVGVFAGILEILFI